MKHLWNDLPTSQLSPQSRETDDPSREGPGTERRQWIRNRGLGTARDPAWHPGTRGKRLRSQVKDGKSLRPDAGAPPLAALPLPDKKPWGSPGVSLSTPRPGGAAKPQLPLPLAAGGLPSPLACRSCDSVRNFLILSDGMAKEIPAVTFRVLMPITSPS